MSVTSTSVASPTAAANAPGHHHSSTPLRSHPPPSTSFTAPASSPSSFSTTSLPPSPTSPSLPINIVGAGLAGCMAALLLSLQGHHIRLIEFRPDIRTSSTTYKDDVPGHLGKLVQSNKRSVNLALSHRGMEALKAAGIFHLIEERLIPMTGRVMHDPAGVLTYQPYGHDDQAIYSINRADLNVLLLDHLSTSPLVTLHFTTKVSRIDPVTATIYSDATPFPALFTVGADGAYSAVRESMRRSMRMDFSMEYISAGYKELHIPPTPDGDFALPHPTGLHIWPRKDFMLIALPNPDRSFTCTLFAPFTGPEGLDSVHSEKEVLAYFRRHYPDVIPLAPTLVEDYQSSPTSALLSIRCQPWSYKDRVLLIGDAAHACVPFYGQGMNAAFEDCLLLSELFAQHAWNVPATIHSFEQQRMAAGHSLVDLSLGNWVEMRAKTADWRFLLQKRVEKVLNQLFPHWWTPLYTMVAFTRIPYDECVRRGNRQDAIIKSAGWGLLGLGVAVVAGTAAWFLAPQATKAKLISRSPLYRIV